MIESIKHLEPKDRSAILSVLTELVLKHPNGISEEAILASRKSLPEELKDIFMDALEEYLLSAGNQSLPNTNP